MPADDLLNVDDDQVTAATATADPIEFCHILIFLFNQGPAARANNPQRPPANTANTANNNFEPSFLKIAQARGLTCDFLVFVNFFTEAVPKITQLLSLPSSDSSISFVKQSLGPTPPLVRMSE